LELANDRSVSATKLWPSDLSLPQLAKMDGTPPTTLSTAASTADPSAFVWTPSDPETTTRFNAAETTETGDFFKYLNGLFCFYFAEIASNLIFRVPFKFHKDGSGKQCCGGNIYDSDIQECCSGDQIASIGSC
jgi:hypothetical protein